ncbi:MAG TPA: transporter substrate-binding domain-containing protein [Burkholderiales bacterium]
MRFLLVIAAALLAGCEHIPVVPTNEAAHQLAPTGTLRVAVLTSNPIIGTRDAATGELAGTTVPLAKELAIRAGVQLRLIEYTAIPQLMAHATSGVWDVAVVAIDPARLNVVDFAPPHLAADGFLTVLVPADSKAKLMADLDQPGKRIAAVSGAAPLMILERTLKNARTVAAANEDAAFALMRDGLADGYAQNRFMLRARAKTLAGSRLLEDSFAGLRLAFALPKGRPLALKFVAEYIEESKDNGLVQGAINDAGMKDEVKVAPLEGH